MPYRLVRCCLIRCFLWLQGKEFPHIAFHVVGSGMGRHPDYPDNVVVYGEMKYVETIRYIRHASFGIAPYVYSRFQNI